MSPRVRAGVTVKRWTRIGAVTAVAIGVLLGAASASGATPAAGHLRYATDSGAKFSNLSRTAKRHDYVIMHAWQQAKMRKIKAADPTTKVLVYKNLTSSKVTTNHTGFSAHGVPYEEADPEHPEWFLLNASGERFTFSSYPNSWAMDVGSPSYQKRWADNVVAELRSEDWDGVFMDSVDTSMKWNYTVSEIAKYPTDAAWQQATESALAHIGPRVRAAGKLAIANIGSWGGNAAVGRSWLQYLDGAMQENFAKWENTPGTGYAPENHWRTDLESLKYAQQQGKDYLAVTHSANDDSRAALYGWASVLLGAEGKAHFALHGDYTNETWFREYEYKIGKPTGPESRDQNGVHRRQFTNGIVVVNPTSSRLSADLSGTYSGSGLSDVANVTLAPNNAAILTRDRGSCSSGGSSEGTEPGGATEGETTVDPGSKKEKKGKIVVKGRVRAIGGSVNRFKGSKLRLKACRRRGGSKAKWVRVRSNGRFVGRLRVCRPGRYKLFVRSPSSGELRWPGSLRVRREHLRC